MHIPFARTFSLAATVLFVGFGTSFAQSDTASASRTGREGAADSSNVFFKKHPYGIGLIYEIADLRAKNLASEMTQAGKRHDVDVDVSNMLGVTGQYSLNEWISLFGVLGFQRFSVDCAPRDKSKEEDSFDIYNAYLQAGLEIGFSFLQARNYQIRALGFFGGTVGFSHIGTAYFNDTPLFGYVRGIGLQLNVHKVALLAGFRSSHVYFHTYHDDHWKDDDYSFMLDFDTMSSPFFSIGIGF